MCCGLKGKPFSQRERGWGEGLLLVAQSARMLAQSAHRAGLNARAIDYFADADTRRYARVLTIPPGSQETQWLALAESLAPKSQGHGLIYGSGIDTQPRLVEILARDRTRLGNSPATLAQVNNPHHFFALLTRLEIPHPETLFSSPTHREGWLIKPSCGEGGKGVGFAAKNRPAPRQSYYQQQIAGNALSVLFLADGPQVRVIGFNTQWTASHDASQPFLFAGAINRAELDAAQRAKMEDYANRLSAALGLVGLNSLDLMLDGETCRVIELNPRPSATMALYDGDFAEGLLAAHIAACLGELPPEREGQSPIRAFRYLFAPRALQIRPDFHWPVHCADIPNPGVAVASGQPICSLMAQGESQGEVESRLKAMEIALLHDLLLTK